MKSPEVGESHNFPQSWVKEGVFSRHGDGQGCSTQAAIGYSRGSRAGRSSSQQLWLQVQTSTSFISSVNGTHLRLWGRDTSESQASEERTPNNSGRLEGKPAYASAIRDEREI